MEKRTQILMALVTVLALLLGGFGGSQLFPRTETQVVTKEVPKIVEKEVVVEKEVEVPVEKEVVSYAKEEELDTVLGYLEDEFGHLEVFEDVDEIVSNIEMEDSARVDAVNYVMGNWYDLLDDEGFIDSHFDDYRVKELSLKEVLKSREDVVFIDREYDDNEFVIDIEFEVEGDASDDDIGELKKSYVARLEVEQDDIDLISLSEV